MQQLDLTLATPAENLALDEALLETAESATDPARGEVLRLWEASAPFVVVGRSSRIADEVDLDACRRLKVPVLRRPSGGSAVLAGPGCLMYAVVLSYERRPELRAIDLAHEFVLSRILASLHGLVPEAELAGTSDLAIAGLKFSGNSLRCKRDHFLYHGTLLYDFPLELIERCLKIPPRQPDYRHGRGHRAFLTNLPTDAPHLSQALRAAWDAHETATDWPRALTEQLAHEKYTQEEWNFRR